MKHLSSEQLERYRQRILAPEEIADVYAHLTECDECSRQTVSSASSAPLFGRFRADHLTGAWSDESHPTAEQLAVYVDDGPDEREHRSIESHITVCSQCQAEVSALRALRAELSIESKGIAPTADAGTAPRRTVESRRWKLRFTILSPLSAVQAACVAAVLAFGLGVGFQQLRSASAKAKLGRAIAPLPSGGSLPILASGSLVMDAQGHLGQVQPVLAPTELLRELNPKPPTLAGNETANRFITLSPVGSVIRTDRPTFIWSTKAGATRYEVAIMISGQEGTVIESGSVTETQWTPSRPLERGKIYRWAVTARRGGADLAVTTGPAGGETRFAIITREQAASLEVAERRYMHDPAKLGVVYLQAGLLAEAEKQFKAAPVDDPAIAVARTLLAQTRALQNARRSSEVR